MISPNISRFLVSQIANQCPSAVFFKDSDQNVMALTIDDVPARDEDDKQSTRQILEVIRSHNRAYKTNVQATFFITTEHVKHKNAKDRLDLDVLAEIRDEGHEIGNHGTLDQRHAKLSPLDFRNEFHQAHQFLSQQTHHPIRWFRPGQAFYTQPMLDLLRTEGQALGYHHQFALASMIPLDTRHGFDAPSFTVQMIGSFTFPGSILVLHGGYRHQALNTVQVLTNVLPQLHEQNYQIVSLSRLIDL